MNKSTIVIIIYILGLIFSALVLDLWSAKTGPKALIGIVWTAIFLISLFYTDKNEQK
jgi:uncharacterized membrane protein